MRIHINTHFHEIKKIIFLDENSDIDSMISELYDEEYLNEDGSLKKSFVGYISLSEAIIKDDSLLEKLLNENIEEFIILSKLFLKERTKEEEKLFEYFYYGAKTLSDIGNIFDLMERYDIQIANYQTIGEELAPYYKLPQDSNYIDYYSLGRDYIHSKADIEEYDGYLIYKKGGLKWNMGNMFLKIFKNTRI